MPELRRIFNGKMLNKVCEVNTRWWLDPIEGDVTMLIILCMNAQDIVPDHYSLFTCLAVVRLRRDEGGLYLLSFFEFELVKLGIILNDLEINRVVYLFKFCR
jgi:hypothetical protein